MFVEFCNFCACVQCQHTWQLYSNTSKMCECGNDIHGAVLCNNTTNSACVHLLDCYCMTLNRTDQYQVGKCFLGCKHILSQKDHIYSLLPSDKFKINHWLCGDLNKNGTMCGNCLPNYSHTVYSYDINCRQCSSDRFQNIARFIAVEFVPLTLFYMLVVVFKISATSPKLSSYVIFSQWAAEPLNVREVLRGVKD